MPTNTLVVYYCASSSGNTVASGALTYYLANVYYGVTSVHHTSTHTHTDTKQ